MQLAKAGATQLRKIVVGRRVYVEVVRKKADIFSSVRCGEKTRLQTFRFRFGHIRLVSIRELMFVKYLTVKLKN